MFQTLTDAFVNANAIRGETSAAVLTLHQVSFRCLPLGLLQLLPDCKNIRVSIRSGGSSISLIWLANGS